MKYPLFPACLAVAIGLAPVSTSAQFRQQGSSDQSDDSDRDSGSSRTESRAAENDTYEPTLIGPTIIRDDQRGRSNRFISAEDALDARESLLERSRRALEPAKPNEFERYVERMTGKTLTRFGSDLILPEGRDFSVPADATIPPDYRINIGDTISISLTGSAEGSVERTVDTDGNIFLQSVGSIRVAGVRYGDLKEYLAGAIGTQFRNFRVGVRAVELRGLRVFVTGYAQNPGSFTINSLSTSLNAILQAGGPSSGGSFRNVRLIRGGGEIANIDLYDILLEGDRSNDRTLESEDVLLIEPADTQIAVFGSVNNEAIFELRPGETILDALQFAGGSNELAEIDRVVLYRADPESQPGPIVIEAAAFASTPLRPADLIQVLPSKSLVQPVSRQSVIVRIEGEVVRPGNYYVAPNTPLDSIVALAGGLTERAYPFGTEFNRQSIVAQQRKNFDEALDQFELTLATAPLVADSSIDAGRQQLQLTAARDTLDELREAEPDGRLVLDIASNAVSLPGDLLLENGDRIYVPPQPTSIGVFGAVYRPASFQLSREGHRIKDYIEQAGGPVRAADKGDIFVVRANGSVLTRDNGALRATALPGDVVFVPIKTQSRDLLAKIAQVSSILFQFGLSAATVAAID
ncbi:capsule biosynthesis protein [Erythrobacter litoralis]|uniref:SLBB domain-containing protein n=1 Tax=Erythrobacter litoralis TaxID=39960 RepID=UPI002435F04B|nr:SLBB domain-containing protein [Erythrobacter litoralis]MDG6079367.1 capsule biosynthesis protein [Erythrobacter litoralis]